MDELAFDAVSVFDEDYLYFVRGGEVRRFPFFVRMFTFTELRDWLLTAGFTVVDGFGEDGTPLTLTSRRLIVTAAL